MEYTVIERDDMPTGHDFVVIRTPDEVIVVIRQGARSLDATAAIWAAARQAAEPSAPRLRVTA